MTDERDDDAFSWAGDEALQAPARPAPLPGAAADAAPGGSGALGLVALGLFGGIAVLESVGWARSAFSGPLAASLSIGGGSPVEVIAFGADLLGRVLAVVAPLVWAGVVAVRLRLPLPRLAWLALGAVVVLPWPVVLGVQ